MNLRQKMNVQGYLFFLLLTVHDLRYLFIYLFFFETIFNAIIVAQNLKVEKIRDEILCFFITNTGVLVAMIDSFDKWSVDLLYTT